MGIRSTVEGLNQGPKVSLNLVVRLLSALHHESCDMCDMYCIVLRCSGCVAQNNLVPEQKPSIQACAVEPRDSKPKAEDSTNTTHVGNQKDLPNTGFAALGSGFRGSGCQG